MAKAFFKQPVQFFHDHNFITDVLDDNRDIPPIGDTKLDPYSNDYKNRVLAQLRLNENYELSDEQQLQLENLIRRYAHIFLLPGAPFKGVNHVFHDIDTGDAQPQYTPPYPKSPAEL